MARPMSRKPIDWGAFWRCFIEFGIVLLAVLAVLIALSHMGGCVSHTKAIANGAMKANREATEIVQKAEETRADLENPPAEVPPTGDVRAWLGRMLSNQLSIISKAQSVQVAATAIVKEVPHVEDKVPWWAALMKLLAVVGGLALLVYIGIATGAFKFIHVWLMGMGLFIPKAKVSSAKLDAEALADPSKLPQAIASRRTIDPAYDAAFRAEKARLEGGGA